MYFHFKIYIKKELKMNEIEKEVISIICPEKSCETKSDEI